MTNTFENIMERITNINNAVVEGRIGEAMSDIGAVAFDFEESATDWNDMEIEIATECMEETHAAVDAAYA